MDTFRILPERPEDADEIEYLYDLSFAPGRNALASYRLREGIPAVADLCCIARDAYDVLAGAIRFWPIRLGRGQVPALLLGPIAVHPTRQGEGVGGLLITESLARAERLGWERVILVGDLPYYSRFGFRRAPLEFPPPTNPDRVLARAIRPGALDGIAGPVFRWDAGAVPIGRSDGQ